MVMVAVSLPPVFVAVIV
jgi:hypothetical protein